MTAAGVIVNPHAGKDLRRLVSAAGQTSDASKVGTLRRVIAGLAEAGVEQILVGADRHGLGERAADASGAATTLVSGPSTGSHLDTVVAAETMWKLGASVVVVLGGDGTCRDVATGWPGVPLVAISTGTNNVFPDPLEGTTAGLAAGLVATGAVPLDTVGTASPRVAVQVDDPLAEATLDDIALVETALVDTSFVGARAVHDPTRLRWIVACIADPAATGLAGVAGRAQPLAAHEPGGILLRLGPGGRRVRVPLTPGTFTTIDVAEVVRLEDGERVTLPGGGVLAHDGERTTPVSTRAAVHVAIDRAGPVRIDVDAVVRLAARERRFDLPETDAREEPDGH